ncbi:MAG: mismatch-specific DNA-glycosylase [Deltaproteobacteria bacterium]|nr:mismatch-specific DNA-glycosylase [Deltaproteobacteria bacterium]
MLASRLKDVWVMRPRILFVGINPSLRSGEVGHHFASPGNPFWRLLHASGLTPVLLRPDEDWRMAESGFALTNLCSRATRSAAELSRDELARGVEALTKKIRRLQPKVVAFVGLSVYQRFFSLKQSGGAGPKPELIEGACVFALPNPSGLNASFPGFAHKLKWFQELRAFAER